MGRDALLSASMALASFAIVMVAYRLIAARLERLSIGPALAFTVCGLLVGGAGPDCSQPEKLTGVGSEVDPSLLLWL